MTGPDRFVASLDQQKQQWSFVMGNVPFPEFGQRRSVSVVVRRGLVLLALVAIPLAGHAAFEIQAGQLAADGAKQGGVAWADFNGDGCLDVAQNTDGGTLLYRQQVTDGGACGGSFVQVRSFTDVKPGRSVVWGDFDGDGRADLAVNHAYRLEVYRNTTGEAGGFDSAVAFDPGNSEGMAWIDHDADGDLDLLVEDDGYGIRIYINRNGVLSENDYIKIHEGDRNGEYLAATDFDVDGDVDFYARRPGTGDTDAEADLFVNDGKGNFSRSNAINEDAKNDQKGGVAFCDFDGDGDFDLVRTDAGTIGVFEFTKDGRFVLRQEFSGSYVGVACADVDNDGDEDLFFTSRGAGNSLLYLNGGGFAFAQGNMGISASGPASGVSFADYDRDGDMDLLINQDGGPSQLWRNTQNDDNYLQVSATVGSRDAVGATIRLYNCEGDAVSGVREINGGMGRGSQGTPFAHFGGIDPEAVYVVGIKFVGGKEQRHAVRPSELTGYQLLTVAEGEESDISLCTAETDSDGDGLPDSIESGLGTNPNNKDSDGDGKEDGAEVGADPAAPGNRDKDDIIDALDSAIVDSDGDGVMDEEDDANADPCIPDATNAACVVVSDRDQDGIPDSVEEGLGTNPDNKDSDGDGKEDGAEVGDDPAAPGNRDKDDIIDALDSAIVDSDGDGVMDEEDDANANPCIPNSSSEACLKVDSDRDGIPDAQDIDDDNDGIPDVAEGAGSGVDTDGDGVPDSLDLDSDNDGLFDLTESGADDAALDSNKDGRIDGGFGANGLADAVETSSDSGITDYNGDGVEDGQRNTDGDSIDGKGIPDFRDLDSDNDGLLDVIEAGLQDPDLNGHIGRDMPAVDSGTGLAAGAGVMPPPDTDGDQVPDYRDLDSDNDGIPDVIEAKLPDPDNNAYLGNGRPPKVDSKGRAEGAGVNPVDTDGDGTPDYQDLDSDGDGKNDLVEAGGGDTDGNGRVDSFTDKDGDGLDDAISPLLGGRPLALPDGDGDGSPDFRDIAAAGDEPILQTGLEGVGGCAVNSRAGFDPVLPLMLGVALLYLLGSRRRDPEESSL
ncbi:MAG TPA: VCBS repeat-containing protein [Gammaproteobacteria bacterium]|nr:VCBS repeat-containing protein [Gammaproteobacteria bacterium]